MQAEGARLVVPHKFHLRGNSLMQADSRVSRTVVRGLIEQELTEKTEEIAVLVTSALFVHKESAVHPLYSQSSAMTSDVIGAAIDAPG